MNDAIRTISLDDIGGLQTVTSQPGQGGFSGFAPQYAVGDQVTVPADATMPRATFKSAGMHSETSTGLSFDQAKGLSLRGNGFGDYQERNIPRLIGFAVLGLVLTLVVTWGASGFGTFDELIQSIQSWLGIESGPEPIRSMVPPSSKKTKVAESKSPNPEVVANNPYWTLPNPLELGAKDAPKGILTQSQGERWRQGMLNSFNYQRHRTVLEIRAARLEGSQFLLVEALNQPKLWIRMEALLALVELGEPVDISATELGLGDARRSLVENYFRRYNDTNSISEAFVLRQAIRLLAAGARQIALEKLALRRNPINDLYLHAATFDPNQDVKAWANKLLAIRPVDIAVQRRFQNIAAGLEVEKTEVIEKTPPTQSNASGEEIPVETMQDQVDVEDVYFLNEAE